MLCARTVPCTDRPDENHVCGMCSGEYCATHFNGPCVCDVLERHEVAQRRVCVHGIREDRTCLTCPTWRRIWL